MSLPEPGDLNWAVPLNNAVQATQAQAQTAAADATQARSDAIYARMKVDEIGTTDSERVSYALLNDGDVQDAIRDALTTSVSTDIADPGTAIGGAANSTFLRRGVTVDTLLATGQPLVIPHRGAGANLAPENTMIAFRAGASYGLGLVDGGDWRTTYDGALACFHDATTDATTNRSRTVSDMSAIEVQNTVIDCATWFGGGFSDQKVLIADELYSTLGGTVVLSPEPKDAGAATALAAIVQRMGIQPSVLPTAFDATWLTPFVAVGCPHVVLNITAMPSAPTRAAHFAAGIKWYGLPYDGAITVANALTLVSEGFRILVGTVGRASHATQVNDWLSIKSSISAWASDDPLYFRHVLDSAYAATYRRTTDPFATQAYYHGHIAGVAGDLGPTYRGVFRGAKRFGFVAGETRWVLAGWACPLASPTSYTINYYVTPDTMGSDDTRWWGVLVGSPNDRGYADSASNTFENGYQCYFRRNGQLLIAEKTAGAAGTALTSTSETLRNPLVTTATLAAGVAITSIPVTATAAAIAAGRMFRLPNDQVVTVSAAGAASGATSIPINSATPTEAVASGSSLPQTVPLRIVVTPTTITFSRQDTATASVVMTDSTSRGPYMYLGQNAGAGGFAGSFSDMAIT